MKRPARRKQQSLPDRVAISKAGRRLTAWCLVLVLMPVLAALGAAASASRPKKRTLPEGASAYHRLLWAGLDRPSFEHPLRPALADSALSKGRTFATLSGIALLAHLPMWGIVFMGELDGDRRPRYQVPLALAAAGSAAGVAWAAQRKGARFSTALAGSALGAGAALGIASASGRNGSLGSMLAGFLAAPVVHGALATLVAAR